MNSKQVYETVNKLFSFMQDVVHAECERRGSADNSREYAENE